MDTQRLTPGSQPGHARHTHSHAYGNQTPLTLIISHHHQLPQGQIFLDPTSRVPSLSHQGREGTADTCKHCPSGGERVRCDHAMRSAALPRKRSPRLTQVTRRRVPGQELKPDKGHTVWQSGTHTVS